MSASETKTIIMTISIIAGHWRGFRCVRAVARFRVKQRDGPQRKYQKTWILRTVAPNFSAEKEVEAMISAQAKRWQESILNKTKPCNPPTTPNLL